MSHLYPAPATKSGRISSTANGIAPSDWVASTTSAAPAPRAAAPIRTRSKTPPSVQWTCGSATTAVRPPIRSRVARVQSPSAGRGTKRTSPPQRRAFSVHG